MRSLDRNKTKFYYCLYTAESMPVDADGNYTGEPSATYGEPIEAYGNISAARGTAEIEQFGTGLSYDKTVTLEGIDWDIDEQTVLFVDSVPNDGALGNPPYDYKVVKVAKSLNEFVLAIAKVRASVDAFGADIYMNMDDYTHQDLSAFTHQYLNEHFLHG